MAARRKERGKGDLYSESSSVSPAKRREEDTAPAPADIREPPSMTVGRNAGRNPNRTMTFGTGSGLRKEGLTIEVDDGEEFESKSSKNNSSFISKGSSAGQTAKDKYGSTGTRQAANNSFVKKSSATVNPLAKSGS